MSGRKAHSLTCETGLDILWSAVHRWQWSAELQHCHNRYSLRAGVCCHLITLSHFHTLDNKLTLSRIHTWLQVITGMRRLQCLWQISHDSWWCRERPCWCGRICSGGHRHIGFVIRASVQVKRWQFTKRFITSWFCCTLPNDCRTLPYFSFYEKPMGIPGLLYRQRQRTAGFLPFGVIPGRLLSESYNIIG